MPYKFAYQEKEKNIAKAVARDISVSPKAAIMLANFVRNKTVTRAQRDLAEVMKKTQAVPYTRFTEGAGHKPGMGPGKYPVKAAREFLILVNSAAANAQDLGLGEELKIISVTTHQAAKQMRQGRNRGRQRKAAHVEIIVAEDQDTKRAAKKTQKPVKKAEEKPAESKAPVKESAPATPKKPAEKAKPASKKEAKPTPKKAPAKKAPTKEEPAKKADAKAEESN